MKPTAVTITMMYDGDECEVSKRIRYEPENDALSFNRNAQRLSSEICIGKLCIGKVKQQVLAVNVSVIKIAESRFSSCQMAADNNLERKRNTIHAKVCLLDNVFQEFIRWESGTVIAEVRFQSCYQSWSYTVNRKELVVFEKEAVHDEAVSYSTNRVWVLSTLNEVKCCEEAIKVLQYVGHPNSKYVMFK